jgi:hypothetical protein
MKSRHPRRPKTRFGETVSLRRAVGLSKAKLIDAVDYPFHDGGIRSVNPAFGRPREALAKKGWVVLVL